MFHFNTLGMGQGVYKLFEKLYISDTAHGTGSGVNDDGLSICIIITPQIIKLQ